MAQPDSLKRSVGLKLTVVSRQLVRQFDQSVERMGVSRAKFGVIALVSRRPGATQRMIAETLEVTEVTAGRLIERLCADGYLERRTDCNDRRAHCIYLTPATQPVLERLAEVAIVHENEAFAGIDADNLRLLEALLEKIGNNLATARVKPSIVSEAPPTSARDAIEA